MMRRFKLWLHRLITRHRNRRIIRNLRKRARQPVGTVQCPRCRRHVKETSHARNAHRQSCVRIPEPKQRSSGWGVTLDKVDPGA